MRLLQFIEYLRHHLVTVVRLCLATLAALFLLDAFPGVVNKEHAHTILEHLPGFWSLFGLGGCILIILVSKWYGHTGIMTREDYYDE